MFNIDVADILGSSLEDGEVRVDMGDAISNSGFAIGAPFWGIDGFYSMPAAPSADGASQAIYMTDGDSKVAIGSRDNRNLTKYGSLSPGDRAIISNGDARVVLKDSANAVTIYTELGSPATKDAVIVDVRGNTDGGTVIIKCGAGHFTMKTDASLPVPTIPGAASNTSISIGNGAGSITITPTGEVIIKGKVVRVAGGSVHLGHDASAPIIGVSGVIYGPTGLTGVPSTSVFVSP